jgi:hypothetical protein
MSSSFRLIVLLNVTRGLCGVSIVDGAQTRLCSLVMSRNDWTVFVAALAVARDGGGVGVVDWRGHHINAVLMQ